ncbi:MAG: amino acid permease [Proteobacteria bacterium]|nr:amino acid permease [Pseudomonadota bacterium]
MANKNRPEAGLQRVIGKLGFSAIVLNGTIGAGIFALPAVAAEKTGLFSPWMFFICGLLIMTVVLSMARAASFFSDTGGPTTYVTHVFGRFAGFQIGWLFTFSRIAAFAANINLMVTYASWFWAPLASGMARTITITVACLALIYVNVIGVKRGLAALFVITALKLIPLSLIVLLGITKINPEIFIAAELPVFEGLGETILVLLYAFVGFESSAIPAGEARNPRRDIPWALIKTTIFIGVFYFLIQLVSISVEPGIGSSETPLTDVAMILMGTAGAGLLALGAVLSIGGNLTAMMLSAPRMIYAMAQGRTLPAWFGDIHPRYHTPSHSIIFLGLCALLLALSGSFIWLAAMSTIVRLLVYAGCILSLPGLQKTIEPVEEQFHLPGGFTIPAIALSLSLWLTTHASMESWLVTAGFAVLGSIFYALTRR